MGHPESESPVWIEEVRVGQRRIYLQVAGDSDEATQAFAAVWGFMSGLQDSLEPSPPDPLVLTHETICVATLDFEWTELLAPSVRSFQDELLKLASSDKADAEIRTGTVRFILGYTPKDEDFRGHGVTFGDKVFIIEPRADVPLSERRYFTSSPTDSRTHVKLLKKLEKSLLNENR